MTNFPESPEKSRISTSYFVIADALSEASATACLASQHVFNAVPFAQMRMERIPDIAEVLVKHEEMSVQFMVSPQYRQLVTQAHCVGDDVRCDC